MPWKNDHKWKRLCLTNGFIQTNKKQLTWKAWAKNYKVRLRPWSTCPSRTGSSKNAIICGFRVKECKINQLHRGSRTPLPTVHRSHAFFCRLTMSGYILPSHCSVNHCAALKHGAMVCSPEVSSAVTNFSVSESKIKLLIFSWVSWDVESCNYLLPCKQFVLHDCFLPRAVKQRRINYNVLIR